MKKPMLASDVPDDLEFPVMASFKLDGVRSTVQEGMFMARSLKPIPNQYIQSHCYTRLECMDGELVVGCPNNEGTFRRTTSGVMSKTGEPDFSFNIFDYMPFDDNDPEIRTKFINRYNELERWFQTSNDIPKWLKLIKHVEVKSRAHLDSMLECALERGYEGIVVRAIDGKYKNGRATKKEGLLLRLKPWADSEATIITTIEQQHNSNVATVNELGNTARSTHQENMIGKDTLGAFVVRDMKTGIEFKIGNGKGLTDELRKELWEMRISLVGKIIKYKHLMVGGYDKPRLAQFLGFRDKLDMGE